MRSRTLRLLALVVLSALGTACGGGGGGQTAGSGGTDFVPFFTGVFQTSNQGTEPASVAGIAFTNRFPTDESTFNGLLP